jgi:acyl-CoA thioester hydrolase
MAERLTRGRIEGSLHVLPLRVYWEDTDASGIVYYANYLRFVERGRSDLLRLAGVNQQALLRDFGLALAVRACAIEYLSPARLDDEIEVHSRLAALRGASLIAEQTVVRDGRALARATIRIACIDSNGRPRRLPQPILSALAALPQSRFEEHHG